MCGIAGIFNLNSEPVNQELLVKMTRLLAHRGPDDEGIYLSANLGFGHRRLSIIDLSTRGHQPMSNEDSTIWITFNGEIYNHLSLREELQRKGHQYKSGTDTETILHLYEEKGIDCLGYLDGEFAFAIWDARRKIIFAARDRLGIKPFYYYISDKTFIFASEIKAVLLHPDIRKEVDLQALSYYLSFSVSPAPLTMFKNIFKLEAGHFLLISEDGRLTKEEYWDAVVPDKISCPEKEAIENIRLKLQESVRERLMSDVSLGVFLSGGVDSSTNVALMSQQINEPVKTFNLAIDGFFGYDETHLAELVSRYFNTEHHSIRINFDDFYSVFDDFAYYSDEPLCDYACIPNFYLAKFARKYGVCVIQVGEGSDEVFCGYPSYVAILNLIRYFQPLPRLMKNIIFHFSRIIEGEKLHYAIERARENKVVFLGGSYLFIEKEKGLLFRPSVNITEFDSSDSYVARIYDNLLKKSPKAGPLDKMIYLDLKVRLPELLLMRSDKMAMANSVEARLPFLDYQFVEYALGLSANLKYQRNITKYIFKKSLESILPKEVVSQPKQGFAGAPMNIFNEDFQEYVLMLYKKTEPLLTQWFNLDNIKNRLIFDRKQMSFREGMKIWSIFTFMLWLKRFFIDR